MSTNHNLLCRELPIVFVSNTTQLTLNEFNFDTTTYEDKHFLSNILENEKLVIVMYDQNSGLLNEINGYYYGVVCKIIDFKDYSTFNEKTNANYTARFNTISRVKVKANLLKEYDKEKLYEFESISKAVNNSIEYDSRLKIIDELIILTNLSVEQNTNLVKLREEYLVEEFSDQLAIDVTEALKSSVYLKPKYIYEEDLVKRLDYLIIDLVSLVENQIKNEKNISYENGKREEISKYIKRNNLDRKEHAEEVLKLTKIIDSLKKNENNLKEDSIDEGTNDSIEKEEKIDFEDSQKFKKYVDSKNLPPYIKKKVLSEYEDIEKKRNGSNDRTNTIAYIKFVLSLPYYEHTQDNTDLEETDKILEESHYGLGIIKERIQEYLAIRILSKEKTSPILCLAGPPGVGKTSLSMGIAKSLGKKIVKLSVGGVSDENVFRGFLKTYTSSTPGKVLNLMKAAGVNNPLFLLDEIDKLSQRNSNSTSLTACLLEMLDPTQNQNFTDYYLDEPYDLSNVMFIATANDLSAIDSALLDRMEIIELASYTLEDKFNIAKKHLLHKAEKQTGLTDIQVNISDEALKIIILNYTFESGVRELQRVINSVYRKIALKYVKEKITKFTVTEDNIEDYLGKPKYKQKKKVITNESEVGLVNGLAVSKLGGAVLQTECTQFSGSGQLVLIGKLGEVMQESASIALSYVKSKKDKYNIDQSLFLNDIHIHCPAGAIPKDGTSAGVTLTTVIVSKLTGKKVDAASAMTGEISLTGKVLPVGGVKEKVIGAYNYGLKRVFIPKENEEDLENIPNEIKENLEIVLVDHVDQILEKVLI